jgi:TPR repeat protein
MPTRHGAILLAMCLAFAGAGVHAVQGPPPNVPPPPETSVYELLELGAPPAATCSCVPTPFALPSYRPGWGYGSGPATPTENAPISDADRRRNAIWYAGEERELARRAAEDALTGNGHASFSVAHHLSLHAFIFGPDERVEQDAVRWLMLAAEQEHPDAFRLLGYRHAHGRGVPQDYAIAAYWFDQGARRDDPISMTAIGFLHAAGRGVEQNWPAAIRWWQRARTRAPVASRYLGDAYACGAGIDENRERALTEYKRFADVDPSSSIQLGHMYVRRCAPPDEKAALAAFRRAADQGYPEAQIELSELLREGRGAEPNPLEAYYWARLAERRIASGDLKKLAAARAGAAGRRLSSLEISAGNDSVQTIIEACAKPAR